MGGVEAEGKDLKVSLTFFGKKLKTSRVRDEGQG